MGVQDQTPTEHHPLPPSQQPQYDPNAFHAHQHQQQQHHQYHHYGYPSQGPGYPPPPPHSQQQPEGGLHHNPYLEAHQTVGYPQWGQHQAQSYVPVPNPYGQQQQQQQVAAPQYQPPPPPVQHGEDCPMYKAVHNGVTGGVMQAVQGYKERSFKAVTVYLKNVPEVMGGVRCPWNKEYGAAKTIFGRGLTGMTARSAIHVEHKTLYSEIASDVATGVLRNGRDFLELISQGVSGGRMIFFTYVINQRNELKFSHTGSRILADNLSKHAMHANAAEAVIYSGEFHVIHTGEGPLLVVDNNSGTYAPPKDHLPKVVELFKRNFPGLQVDGWDRDDARLKHSISSCPSRSGA